MSDAATDALSDRLAAYLAKQLPGASDVAVFGTDSLELSVFPPGSTVEP